MKENTNSATFFDTLILRTPLLPTQEVYSNEEIVAFFSLPTGQELLYYASPTLLSEFNKQYAAKKISDKLKETLYKYYSRMSTRTTPFGLFAGLSLVKWASDQNNDKGIVFNSRITKNIKLDSSIVSLLIEKLKLTSTFKNFTTVKPNNSIYQVDNELRYVQYTTEKSGSRSHTLTAAKVEDHLLAVLEFSQESVLMNDIIEAFVEQGVDEKSAQSYIYELFNEQILTSKDELVTFGNWTLKDTVSFLLKNTKDDAVSALDKIKEIYETIDDISKKTNVPIQDYIDVGNIIDEILPNHSVKSSLQVDLYKHTKKAFLGSSYIQTLNEALSCLKRLSDKHKNEKLDSFKSNYIQRYGNQFMPLLEVLDIEHGIGYGIESVADDNPLSKDLYFPAGATNTDTSFSPLDTWKLALLSKNSGEDQIQLTDSLLSERSGDDIPGLSPTFQMTFRILEGERIMINGVGGATASTMYGRFTDLHNEIHQLATEVSEYESKVYGEEDSIVAEIVYLPEGVVGNISNRTNFRKYSIPYLGESESKERVLASDILVSVISNTVVLYSKKHKKRIIPKMSNAHNYSMKSQPVYIFLCDLQFQDIQSYYNFSWGPVGQYFEILPRIVYKNIILHKKQWNIKTTDEERKAIKAGEISAEAFLSKHQLDRKLLIIEGDNELFIDQENSTCVAILRSYLEKYSLIVLQEYIPPSSAVVDEQGKTYVNQFVASGMSNNSVSNTITKNISTVVQEITTSTQDVYKYTPLTNWVYFKLYMGIKFADEFISDHLLSFVKSLDDTIDEWFFIRYTDPNFHLRVRFKGKDSEKISIITQQFTEHISQLVASHRIYTFSIDTYIRESERYRYMDYDKIEKIFHLDSLAVSKIIALKESESIGYESWKACIFLIDSLLKSFNYSIDDSFRVLTILRESWFYEFSIQKAARKRLQKVYQARRKEVFSLIQDEDNAFTSSIRPIALTRENNIRALVQSNEKGKNYDDLLCSLIHMICNRLVVSHARKNELVLYYMLSEYYQSMVYISKVKTK